MTDPTREVDIDAFMGVADDVLREDGLALAVAHLAGTHFVGDDCPPDGHRGEAIVVPPEHEAAEQAAMATLGLVEGAPAPEQRKPRKSAPEPSEPVRGRLSALVYASSSGGVPHVVSVIREGTPEVACICKAGQFNLPRGCWAMVDAREVLGLPAQGGE